MLQLVVPVAVIGLFWFLGFWPFDRSYTYLPKYTEFRTKKIDAPPPPK